MPYYYNPWKNVVPVPIEELAECVLNLGMKYIDYDTNQMLVWTKERILAHWYTYGDKLDAYILFVKSNLIDYYSIGVRYGNLDYEYLSLLGNTDKVKLLLDKYAIYV